MNIIKLINRNRYTREGNQALKNRVNLEWFRDKTNLGDYLSPVVCEYMLAQRGLSFDIPVSGTKHLMAVGSILGGRGDFDAVVWGSGVKSFSEAFAVRRRKLFQKLDVRAVRGPITRDILRQSGIGCPEVYGDPAVLMPLIYQPEKVCASGTAAVLHFLAEKEDVSADVEYLDICTEDYRGFIDRLCSAEKVISSSLHGIILAEAYGVPAVFLSKDRESEMMKYYDWYFSTGRMTVKAAQTMEEALETEPMPLPVLTGMREALLRSFPYDLWE